MTDKPREYGHDPIPGRVEKGLQPIPARPEPSGLGPETAGLQPILPVTPVNEAPQSNDD
jgi:hypothetical protein